MSALHYFRSAFILTALGLAAAAALGFVYEETWSGAGRFIFIAAVLAVLEISLSFDNAIINARILRNMSAVWQQRFLTWGIIIAVFGMRILFPLLIVALAAHINPIAALQLAIFQPQAYAHIMESAHLGISAFGGTFLLLVGLSFFFDSHKNIHWLKPLEAGAQKLAKAHGVETAIALLLMLAVCGLLEESKQLSFLTAALYGLLAFIAVEAVSALLDSGAAENKAESGGMGAAKQAGIGAFLYLEVLDASFSFDGVIGAFALSTNIFIIAVGLGIGALYVRSLTFMLVRRQNLSRYLYLEHGAFYAVLALALIMYAQALFPVPEAVTGLIGAGFILAGYLSSLRARRGADKAKISAAKTEGNAGGRKGGK